MWSNCSPYIVLNHDFTLGSFSCIFLVYFHHVKIMVFVYLDRTGRSSVIVRTVMVDPYVRTLTIAVWMFVHPMEYVYPVLIIVIHVFVNPTIPVFFSNLTLIDTTMDVLGQNCTILNACASNPCVFGGTCLSSGNNSFICLCPTNYFGLTCNQSLCTNNPCKIRISTE